MRYLTGVFCCCLQLLLPNFAEAQLPSGTIAPDFIAKDINGQTYHLYDILNSNKIVLLEMGATWCPPCWAYHQSHAVQDFYTEHGPNGDNRARAFWIEGDPQTNTNCIYGSQGCNNVTYGNFAEGITYPILDNASIVSDFHITYYPSLYIVCPNKRVYEVEPVGAEGLWEKAQVCPVAFGQHNAGIFAHDPGYNLPEICGGVNLSPSFMLTNLGSEPLTSASIFMRWNGDITQTIEWSGNLPTFGEAPIQFNPIQVFEEGTLNTVISTINNNSVGDEDFSNNYANNIYSKSQHFEKMQVVLKIRTDNYGNETYWELRDEFDNVLEHGGNQWVGPNGGGAFPFGIDNGPGSYPSNALIKDTLELPSPGCYSIHFSDAFGDGMCCQYGNGYYKLYNIDNPVTPIISSGQYEAYDRHAFSAGLLSSAPEQQQVMLVDVFPNPVDDVLYVDMGSSGEADVAVQVYNSLGQSVIEPLIEHLDGGDNTLRLPMQQLASGWYYLSLVPEQGKGRVLCRKFAVQH